MDQLRHAFAEFQVMLTQLHIMLPVDLLQKLATYLVVEIKKRPTDRTGGPCQCVITS